MRKGGRLSGILDTIPRARARPPEPVREALRLAPRIGPLSVYPQLPGHGGIFLFGLDPLTGRVVHERHMYGPYDAEGYPIITSQIASGSGLDGSKNDVFFTDGELLFLRQQAFRPDLSPLRSAVLQPPLSNVTL